MRAPEYRAFNKWTKEMEQVLLICFVNKYVDVLPYRNLEGGNQEQWFFNVIELMKDIQYSDTDGKRLFESDVCKCTTKNGDDKIGVITFQKVSYCLSVTSDRGMNEGKTYHWRLSGFEFIEKLGNRFENPELLKTNP